MTAVPHARLTVHAQSGVIWRRLDAVTGAFSMVSAHNWGARILSGQVVSGAHRYCFLRLDRERLLTAIQARYRVELSPTPLRSRLRDRALGAVRRLLPHPRPGRWGA